MGAAGGPVGAAKGWAPSLAASTSVATEFTMCFLEPAKGLLIATYIYHRILADNKTCSDVFLGERS